MRLKIREPLARRALESVLEVTGRYGTWIATIGVDDQSPVRRYERLTALADYLEGLFEKPEIVVDLEKREANLLVSCTVFSMSSIVDSIRADTSANDFEQVDLSVGELYSVAIEFAVNTVRLIPRLDEKRPLHADVRRIIDAINATVHSGKIQPMPPLTKPSSSPNLAGCVPIVTEEELRGNQWNGGDTAARHLVAKRRTHHASPPGAEVGSCVELGAQPAAPEMDDLGPDPGFEESPMSGGSASVSDEDLFENGFPINMACITERGLVRQIEADREMFDMALGADEFRIVAVMLCSLLESVILQLSIPRRRELQLSGTPDAWDLHNLLIGFTQDPQIAQDRLTLERVLIGRHLLMPAEQLMRPHDPQRDEIAGMLESVSRFLAHVGFSTSNPGPS